MAENGNIERCTFKVTHATEEYEQYEISRVSNSLPVAKINDQYQCLFNLRGNSRVFSEQILENTTASLLYEKLKTTDASKNFRYENYTDSNLGGHIGAVPACPSGYNIPSSEEYSKMLSGFTFQPENDAIFLTWTNSDRDLIRIETHIKPDVMHESESLGPINLYSVTGAVSGEQIIFSGQAINMIIQVLLQRLHFSRMEHHREPGAFGTATVKIERQIKMVTKLDYSMY